MTTLPCAVESKFADTRLRADLRGDRGRRPPDRVSRRTGAAGRGVRSSPPASRELSFMRLPTSAVILAVGASLGPIGAQDRPAIGDGQMRLVCIDEDRRAHSSDLFAGDRSPTHCWAWNDTHALRAASLPARKPPACAMTDLSGAARLSIRVRSPEASDGHTDGGTSHPGEVEIVAAPAEMWREAPIGLLPTWTAALGRT